MKRPARKLALFLLLLVGGAIINIAVAWVCSLNHLHDRQAGSVHAEILRWWKRTAPATFDHQPRHQGFERGIGREYVTLPPYPAAVRREFYVRRDRSGWPILSMEMSLWYCYHQQNTVHISTWKPESFGDDFDGLPLRPIWPGFAINTGFYAALLWLIFAAPFALRLSIRRRRGLCPACAYPVGTSDICTECGKPIVEHTAQTQKAEMT